jgi:hypothetical protein
MRVNIGNLQAEINSMDAYNLAAMAARVLEDRPSFRAIRANVLAGNEPETVTIYTTRARVPENSHDASHERLVVHGNNAHISLDAHDHTTLEALIRPVEGFKRHV